jgi:hypothetical protein
MEPISDDPGRGGRPEDFILPVCYEKTTATGSQELLAYWQWVWGTDTTSSRWVFVTRTEVTPWPNR